MLTTTKPYSDACEENKAAIRAMLEGYLDGVDSLLEIGSGTGQHAATFALLFPDLIWQASDLGINLPGIRLWIEEANLANLPAALELDVNGPWPERQFGAIFSANTAHIMSAADVDSMFRGVPKVLLRGGVFMLYGPFNYGGKFTSGSNARFDQWLKDRDPQSGIKDFETLDALARDVGLELIRDHEMPVNNRTLVWRRAAAD